MASAQHKSDKDRPTRPLTKEELKAFQTALETSRVCPACGLPNAPDQSICTRCQASLIEQDRTLEFSRLDDDLRSQLRDVLGNVFLAGQVSITLEVGQAKIALPVADVVTMGRDDPASNTPHIDLSPYGAYERGVSRKHVQFRRTNTLVYVSDMGSTNGTFINGRQLLPQDKRLLHNGDELRLGQLRMKVKF